MDLSSLPFTVAALNAAYDEGVKAAAVAGEVLRRHRAVGDPGIFITPPDETRLAAAVAALPPRSAATPLWGLPIAVKDNIDVAGWPTTAACPAFAYVPTASASVVERLAAAGALIIGKTNLDQFATGLVGVRTPYPVPRNACDPTRVPGGSSSGSAVAVAQGLCVASLGTDTAGSGRVPAALNNLVGLKPSLGALSTRGVVPACRTLDCVSVFATSVDDAWAVFQAAAGFDAADPYSRPVAVDSPDGAAPIRTVGLPVGDDLVLFGDPAAHAAWDAAVETLHREGIRTVPVPMGAFLETARLLYEGPWVAERHAAMQEILAREPDVVFPTTRRIVEGATRYSATDAFRAFYRLAELRRATEPTWGLVDAIAVPTAPLFPTLAELEADPIGPNSKLGTYTNFVNLLDLAALAVPGPFRSDGLPAGLTLIAPAGSDARLAALGRRIALPR